MTSLSLNPGTWTLDPLHCAVEFTVRHMAISKVRGRFRAFTAALDVGADLASTVLRAEIDMSSVDTGNADRDAHLRNSDFFDVEAHPSMVFVSTAIRPDGDSYLVDGELTINGVTNRETLSVDFHGVETFPGDGSVHAGFEATGTIRRSVYGVDFNVPLAAGGVVIADKIGIELDIQLLAPAAVTA